MPLEQKQNPIAYPIDGPIINPDGTVYGYTYQPSRLEFAFGTSTSALGASRITNDLQGNVTSGQVGDPNDPWGFALSPAVLNQSNFALFVRRATTGTEDTGLPRLVAAVAIDVYYNPTSGGSLVQERTSVHQSSWIGKETTKGTVVATPTRLTSINVQPQMQAEIKELRGPGEKLPYDQVLVSEHCQLPFDGYPSYNELPFVLAALVAQPASGLIPTATTAYRHVMRMSTRSDDPINSYTCVYGDSVRAHQVAAGQFTEMTLNFTRSEATMQGNGFAWRITDPVTVPAATTEIQTLTLNGAPTGGTFRLTFRGHETADIAWSGTPATQLTNIQAALVALPTIGAAGVAVSGAGPFTVTFNGAALAGQNMPQLVLSKNNLTGGTTPTWAIAETTKGGYSEVKVLPISPGSVGIYLSNSYATLASSKMTRIHVSEIKISGKGKPYWTINDSLPSYTNVVETPCSVEIKVTAQADSAAMGILSDLRAGNTKFFRLAASSAVQGVTIDGTNPFQMIFESAVKVASPLPFKVDQEVYATEFTLKAKFDVASGISPTFQFDNDVVSY